MHFVTSIKNPFGGESWDQYTERMLKKASAEKVVAEPTPKVAAGKASAEGDEEHGVVISLPADKEFQKGESVTMTKKDEKSTKKSEPKAEKSEKEEPKEEKKEATYKNQWIKVSKLSGKQKEKLRSYFEGSVKYPRGYVDALLAD